MAEPPAYTRHASGTQPPYLYPDYASTVKRAPTRPLISFEHTLSEITGPSFTTDWAGVPATDLTRQHKGEPLGERIIVTGRILDEVSRPIPNTLVELWQCNAAGRYHHPVDQHDAPLDPNFTGAGQAYTDAEGRYTFITIKPGAYPWRNAPNAWRPAHLHFGVFGGGFVARLITQMYFPGDPLLEFDPIFHSVPDEAARRRLISSFDWLNTEPDLSLGFRFDIVLRGRNATPMER
jgi:protocatechuate 3,4-dioxygenase, beta subunit